jgi:SAM-dependent methyltransferase
MRRDWDDRARRDAFYYIASWRKDWDADSFFRSGEEDYQRLVEPLLAEYGFDPQGTAMLEVGCGAGRMTHCFARYFREVYALDVSLEMLQRAQTLLPSSPNVIWVLEPGPGLSKVASESVDFVFSYLVLQHLPVERLVLDLVREILRVLRKGGMFLFQFNSSPHPSMNWKGRLVWGVIDELWQLGLERLSRALTSAVKLDSAIAGRTWRGASVEAGKVSEVARAAGCSAPHIEGENGPMTWCWGTKSDADGK